MKFDPIRRVSSWDRMRATEALQRQPSWRIGALTTTLVIPILAILTMIRKGPAPTAETALDDPGVSLARPSVAHRNLLCRQNLTSSESTAVESVEQTLKQWSQHIRFETQRHLYRFHRNPAEFENSGGFFRLLMMAVVLAEDYGVHYDTARRAGPEQTRIDDGFFANPDLVFLTGLLGPERSGTCSSLPVLYVAIGRELGYPLKLVTTKGHLFVRWEGEGERFNVETAGQGLNRFSDDYYRHWPFEITKEEELAEGYLQSLTPEGEFAVFLSIRGMCLREQGRWAEAAEAFRDAVKFAPGCRSYKSMLATLEQQAHQTQSASAPITPSQPPQPITKL